MKKLKLWQKQYFATLLLFVMTFYGCVLFLACNSFSGAFSLAQEAAAQECGMILQAIRADREIVAQRGGESEEADAAIVAEYGAYYGRRNVGLRYVSSGGTIHYDNISEDIPFGRTSHGKLSLVRDADGTAYFFTSMKLGNGVLSCAKQTEELFADQRQLTLILLGAAGVFTAALTVGLYFTLKQIYRPIDNLAHELRTPLTVVNGYAQYITLAAIDEEERLNAAAFIVYESRRLQDIVDKLLVLSNIKKGELDRVRVSVEGLFSRAQQMYPGITCSVGFPYVMGDAVMLDSLIGNLVDNAVKVSGNSETVELVARDGCIAVMDRGPGMSESLRRRLNDPANKERYSETGGSGLGIQLCHQIAEQHNAALSFENRPGGGIIAKVKLFTES